MKKLKSVLLVEDDSDDQLIFIEALSKIKEAILYGVAANGEEALKKLNSGNILPDIIFMDLIMPVMNGVECLSEIMKNPRTENIPVIFLATSIWHPGLLSSNGAKAIIKKPADLKTLIGMLERIINLKFIPRSSELITH